MESINKEFKKNKGEILFFEIEKGFNAYNPTAPFKIGKEEIILARAENINTFVSYVAPFFFENGIWKKIDWELSKLELEDPFITKIENELIFGAVSILPHQKGTPPTEFFTVFYKGKDIFSLNKFAQGPFMMKDIRLVDKKNGKIGIFTRPKGDKFLRGRIGYLEISDLNELNSKNLYEAEIIDIPVSKEEWVGSNEVHLLENGKLGVLGHLAYEDKKGNLHYSAITFVFDPEKFKAEDFKIITQRKDFPEGKTKSEKTKDVVFPGGIIIEDKYAILYVGLSDAEVGRIKIKNPWENL